MNKQPFYHRVDGILFTSTSGFDEADFIELLRGASKTPRGKQLGLLEDSIEVEPGGYQDPEAGDPGDLM